RQQPDFHASGHRRVLRPALELALSLAPVSPHVMHPMRCHRAGLSAFILLAQGCPPLLAQWKALGRPLAFPMQLRATLHTILIHPKIRNLYLAGISADTARASGIWRSGDPVDSVKQRVAAPGAPGRLLVVTPRQGVFALQVVSGAAQASVN